MPSGNRPFSEAMLTKICDATRPHWVITLRPRQNGRHCPEDRFKWMWLNKDVCISIKIPLKFVPRGPIYNIPALAPTYGLAKTRRQAIILTNGVWFTDARYFVDLKSGTDPAHQLVFPKPQIRPFLFMFVKTLESVHQGPFSVFCSE